MLSPKRLVEKAKKGLSSTRANSRSRSLDGNGAAAKEGHFVVYTVEGTRFAVPLVFLRSCVFEELLKVSAEEFGLPGEGPITLVCSGFFMKYILSMLKRSMSRDVENELLASINANLSCNSSAGGERFAFLPQLSCNSSLADPPSHRQLIVV